MTSYASEHHHRSKYGSTPLGQQKVAIPRLQRVEKGQSGTKDRRRVPRACTGCHSHKIKCSGDRPRCKHCATTNRECVYIMPRKDRLKIVTEHVHQFAALLKEIRTRVSPEDGDRIGKLLDEAYDDLSEARQPPTPSTLDSDTHGSQGSGEFVVEDHIGSLDSLETEGLDLLDEDLHQDEARPTGFVGYSSEVQWLRAVASAQTDKLEGDWTGSGPQRRGSYAPGGESVNSFSFWADCDDVGVDFYVDPYDLPQPEVAEHLVQCYMSKVHDSFPILPRKGFEDQTRMYFTALRNGTPPRLSPKWQATLNLVFAIGANYSQLRDSTWRANDHIMYQARARAFGLNEASITNHPDVPQIQGLGLLAFYWLSAGQVSRAWTIVGVALRSAYALGLHVRNEVPTATATVRVSLVQIWWSLYSLERTLSIITGRPSIVVDSCCSVPLPMVSPEEDPDEVGTTYRRQTAKASTQHTKPTFTVSHRPSVDPPLIPLDLGTSDAHSGSYFRAVVQLSIICQNILTALYSAGTIIRTPSDIQQDMTLLGQRLDQWVSSLPEEFQEPSREPENRFGRERMLLRFQLCSAKILLTRPCLVERRQPWKDAGDATFSKRMADICVEAAKTIVASLPDEPCPGLYEQGPWWCIVHHMMQAISIFLLALSYPSSTSQDVTTMIHCVRKTICWLQTMTGSVAERAHHVAFKCFQKVAKLYAVDVSDLWNRIDRFAEGSVMQRSGSDANVGRAAPVQSGPLPSVSTSVPGFAVYASYDAATASTAFPSHHGVPVFDKDYRMNR